MKAYRYPIIAITTSMNKTVFNFRLKKINTTSAFMSSWWSGYLLPWMTVYRWHDLNDRKHMTGVISRKYWSWELTYIDRTEQLNICVILDLGWFLIEKKRRAIIVMNENVYVWTIEKYQTLNFFSAKKLRHIQNYAWQQRYDDSTE